MHPQSSNRLSKSNSIIDIKSKIIICLNTNWLLKNAEIKFTRIRWQSNTQEFVRQPWRALISNQKEDIKSIHEHLIHPNQRHINAKRNVPTTNQWQPWSGRTHGHLKRPIPNVVFIFSNLKIGDLFLIYNI